MFLQVVAKEQEHSDKVRREEGGPMRQAGRQQVGRAPSSHVTWWYCSSSA